jgi:hypothetical protein
MQSHFGTTDRNYTGLGNRSNEPASGSSFGSLQLDEHKGNEFIGQAIDYQNTVASRKLMVDAYRLRRLDFIKLGIAAMELEALEGASQTIERCRPIMLIETIKTDGTQLRRWLEQPRYCVIDTGINVVAIHANDRSLDDIAPQAPLKPSPGVSLTAIRPAASGRAPRLSARAIARARRSRS